MRIFTFLTFLSLVITACKGTQKCKYKPSPIFSADLPHIVQYQFEQQGRQSLESLLLDNSILLEIEQSVCETSRQEYRFSVPGNYGAYPDSMWMVEAVLQLNYLSKLSPGHGLLREWAAALDEHRPQMKLGELEEVAPGIFISVDRVIGPKQSTLLLVFDQQ